LRTLTCNPFNDEEEKTMSKTPLIILIGADKGGVGKTTTTRALADFAEARHAGATLFGGARDRELSRFASAARMIDITKTRGQMEVFDQLQGLTIVDLCAGELSPTMRAIRDTHFLDDVAAGSVNLTLLHVVGPVDSSMREIAEIAALVGTSVKHLIVKNRVSDDSDFADWDSDPRYSAKLQSMEGMTINLPHLTADAADALQKLGGSFVRFSRDASQSRILRGYVRSWLEAIWRDFDRVGLGELIASAVG